MEHDQLPQVQKGSGRHSKPLNFSSLEEVKKIKKEVLRGHSNLFEGIGCFESENYFTVDKSVPHLNLIPHRVAYALLEPLHKVLDRMLKNGIIRELAQGD